MPIQRVPTLHALCLHRHAVPIYYIYYIRVYRDPPIMCAHIRKFNLTRGASVNCGMFEWTLCFTASDPKAIHSCAEKDESITA